MRPVLLVHGINDTGGNFRKMIAALREHGVQHVAAVDLTPNDGSASISELAQQLDSAAVRLLAESGSDRLDLIGFSMGSLVSRYWLQRMGGRARTRKFISISGPHAGTWLAHLSRQVGIREMRPNSALLQDLEGDPDPWDEVEVHVMWTPLDLIILPAKSCMLAKATSAKSYPVVLHPLMLSDRRVISDVVRILARRKEAQAALVP